MDEKTYQVNELRRFQQQKSAFFDTVKDFDEWIIASDVHTQIEWIENGTFGAGACLELQRIFQGLSNRTNKTARIGGVVLMAFYGAPFSKWNKLSKAAQAKMNKAVNKWIAQEHDFALQSVL